MTADKRTDAYVYFKSAIETRYTIMSIKLGFNKGFYPENGKCTTKALQERYTVDGYMKDDEGTETRSIQGREYGKTMVWGAAWFFCKPRKPTLPVQKCTDLDKS